MCAFLQFLGFVTYHFYCTLKSFGKSLRYRNLDDRTVAVAKPTANTVKVAMDEPSNTARQQPKYVIWLLTANTVKVAMDEPSSTARQQPKYVIWLDHEPLLNTGSSI